MHESFTNKPDLRRAKQDPIPKNLDQILNNDQKTTIDDLEAFGWKLWFVRRPLFQPVVPVLVNAANDLIAIIGENGAVDSGHSTTTKLSMRKRLIRDKSEMPDSDLFYFDTQQEMEFWM